MSGKGSKTPSEKRKRAPPETRNDNGEETDDHSKPKLTPASSSKHQNARKRKRTQRAPDTNTVTSSASDNGAQRAPASSKILNGLVLSVSNLDKSHATTSGNYSYNAIAQELKAAGATVSSQVHKRVHALVCHTAIRPNTMESSAATTTTTTTTTAAAVTQRVRKALKRHIDIVHVAWVRDSVAQRKRLDMQPYVLNQAAAAAVARYEQTQKEQKETHDSDAKDESDDDDNGDGLVEDSYHIITGWTEPVPLDCCCVCHENGDDDCMWCRSCNVTLATNNKGV